MRWSVADHASYQLSIEELLDMGRKGIKGGRNFGQSAHLKKLVVGEEVEARECHALELEVIFKLLLDLLQDIVPTRKLLRLPRRGASSHAVGVLRDLLHDILQPLVDIEEHLGLGGKLALDVG